MRKYTFYNGVCMGVRFEMGSFVEYVVASSLSVEKFKGL